MYRDSRIDPKRDLRTARFGPAAQFWVGVVDGIFCVKLRLRNKVGVYGLGAFTVDVVFVFPVRSGYFVANSVKVVCNASAFSRS
jgi:hypothetical protein